MKDNGRILKEHLATLLSFDLEDVGDVFDSLLEFDSEEDLLEYIEALLGEDTEQIHTFVKNIIRFQQGLSLLTPDQDNMSGDIGKQKEKKRIESDIKQLSATEKSLPAEIPQKSKKQQEAVKVEREKKEMKRQQDSRRKRDEDQRQQLLQRHQQQQEEALLEFKRKQEEERINLELAKSIAEMSVTDEEQQEPKNNTRTQNAVTKPSSVKPQPVKETRPLKGKAMVVCGCFGTTHKVLTNCLHCGRIACAKEGYDYCPHCSNLIEKVTISTIPGQVDEAMLHKERLLKFDRESAKRTAVFDDQADYFQNSTSTWLTDNEQQEARSKEEQRRRDLHTIKKHVLNIEF